MTGRTTQPALSEGPLLHRCTTMKGGTLMSAENSARSVRQADGLDPVRALQRCAPIAVPSRIAHVAFSSFFDKLTRSDVMWRAWVYVATNQGAPGVDGVSIADIQDGDTEVGAAVFLDGLVAELRSGSYRPKPLRRVHIPKPGKPGETRRLGIPTIADRVIMTAAKIVLEPIFEADFHPAASGSARSVRRTRPSKPSDRRPTRVGCGCSTPTSRRASTTSTTTPSWARSNAGSLTGRC